MHSYPALVLLKRRRKPRRMWGKMGGRKETRLKTGKVGKGRGGEEREAMREKKREVRGRKRLPLGKMDNEHVAERSLP